MLALAKFMKQRDYPTARPPRGNSKGLRNLVWRFASDIYCAMHKK
jgi:hypothetical protein